jgi:predicted transcriptional regulator
MKEDREFKWMANLLSSQYSKYNVFTKEGIKLSDFESCANESARNKEFSKWFKYLIEKNVVKFLDYKNNPKGGSPIKLYFVSKEKLINLLSENYLFKKLDKVFTIID